MAFNRHLTVNADRGNSMRSKVVAQLLSDPGVRGRYRMAVVDRVTRQEMSGYVRRAWAEERTLTLLGVSKSGFDIPRRG